MDAPEQVAAISEETQSIFSMVMQYAQNQPVWTLVYVVVFCFAAVVILRGWPNIVIKRGG